MYVHMGDVVKELRERKGWSKERLARHARINRRTVTLIEETGDGRIDSLERLLGVMGYELEAVPIR